MQYRRFGAQNCKCRCFPARYALSVQWQDVPRSSGQSGESRSYRRAIEVGINHIETARGYGTSEMQLGGILPTFPRDQLIVQTKVNPSQNPREFHHKFEQSLLT